MKIISYVVFILTVSSVFADEDPCDRYRDNPNQYGQCRNGSSGNGNGQQANNNNVPYNECQRRLTNVTPAPLSGTALASVSIYYQAGRQNNQPLTAAKASTSPVPINGIVPSKSFDLRYCRSLEAISGRIGFDFSATDSKRSMDGAITCVQKSGITADWESCSSAIGLYNAIQVAEAAMQQFQAIRSNSVQNQASQQAAQRTAAGDGQNAMFDAQTANVNNAKELNQQQAAAYAAAVAALYSKVQSWIKEDKNVFTQAGCGQSGQGQQRTGQSGSTSSSSSSDFTPASNTIVFADENSVPVQETCPQAASRAYDQYHSIVYANREAKANLTRAAFQYALKAIQAGIKANQLGDIANKLQEAKKATEDPYNPATFDYCAVNNADPKCAGSVTRTSGSGLQDGGFGLGDSFGNNAIGNLGDEEKMGNDPLAPLAGNNAVADTGNPFAADAAKANKILDPAAAASISAAQPAGGSGSGGAPGLGGGSASLGNDTPGADDSKKESDIKANKADGKYSDATGAGGFQAIKPLKEENPFANLFGDKGGKLEEDRSIASGDIDGQDSGLFAKISKRYGQVQADKRIEAKNLDE